MKPSKQGIERAIQLALRAQEIAGEHALIHATLARWYSHVFEFGISHDRETLQIADEHASKALELAPELGLALFAKAHVRFKEWLGRAIDWGFCNHRYLEEYNPFLTPLHGKPRFQRLVDTARRKQEAFGA